MKPNIETQNKILKLFKQGMTGYAIHKELNLAISTVYGILRKVKQNEYV